MNQPRPPVAQTFRASVALAQREWVRFFRQRTRVIGAIGQPLIFWILFGAGLRGSFSSPDWSEQLGREVTYQEYFFPGIAVLIILFTAIFSTISVIEDRREGFLQGVLVAPVSRSAIVLGKLLGGTGIALLQAALFLLVGPALSLIGLAPEMPIDWSIQKFLLAAVWMCLIAVQLTAIGFLIAWPMSSTQGYHAIMSVFLMPMWLLSGAFFPGSGSMWLSWVIRLNPLTYGVAGLRRLMYSSALPVSNGLPSMAMCVAVTIVSLAVVFAAALWLVSRPSATNVV